MNILAELINCATTSGGGLRKRSKDRLMGHQQQIEQKRIIKQSFQTIAKALPEIVPNFYMRLFELHPELRPLFRSNIQEQPKKFLDMLAMLIGLIDDIEEQGSLIKHLGKRHLGYGVKPKHYTMVGDALLWAFEEVLKDRFSGEVKSAWMMLYGEITKLAIGDEKETSATKLTGKDKTLIRESFMQIAIAEKDTIKLFYETLFKLDPSAIPLFEGVKIEAQGDKVIQTLGALIASMDRLDEVVKDIVDLARRHVSYGVTYEQYLSFKDALISMMKSSISNFSVESENAWNKLFELILPHVQKVYRTSKR